MNALEGKLRRLVDAARAARQRRVLAISHVPSDGELGELCAAVGLRDIAWVGGESGVLPRSLLGAERDAVVLDLRERFDPEALGAVHGAVRAGGLLILRAPSGGWIGRLGVRAARLLAALPDAPSAPSAQDTSEQRRAVERLIAMIDAASPQPIVLVADRGRGKSAALGMAAAHAIALGMDVRVIAPELQAIESLERFAREGALARGVRQEILARRLRHLGRHPPAEIDPHALWLLDEAAALPVAVLRQLAAVPRIAFATTVHGYEGTGRGFTERFLGSLTAARPQTEILELREPIRWAPGDPLERFAFDALLLDASPASVESIGESIISGGATPPQLPPVEVATARCASLRSVIATYRAVDRDALAGNETMLRELFGLLVAAHYRTSPRDLAALLDGPDVEVHALYAGGHPVAAAMGSLEGGLPQESIDAMRRGLFRPAGQAIPETFVAHCRMPRAGVLKGMRVVRIAVHPALQRRGLGTLLLSHLAQIARERGLDWVGALFGASRELLAFWMRAGFVPLRLSMSRGAASGEHSVAVLLPCSREAQIVAKELRAALAEDLPRQLGDALCDLDPDVALSALRDAPARVPRLSDRQIDQLVACAFGGLPQAVAANAITELVAATIHAPLPTLDAQARRALVCRVLQHRAWEEIVRELGVDSVADAMRAVRRALRRLVLAHCGERARHLAEDYPVKE